jgi:serralysin
MVDIPGNNTSTATFDGNPNRMTTFSGELETFNDKDWISVNLTAGTTYEFFGSVESAAAFSGGDSIMRLLDENGVELIINDNVFAGSNFNSAFSFTAMMTGTYFVEMSSSGGTPGRYSVAVVADESHQRLTTGADNFSGAAGAQLIVGDMGNDTITLDGVLPLDALGEQGNDSITGDSGNNFISGGLGNDNLIGLSGADRLFGDAGEDLIYGGDGDDVVKGGDGADALHGEDEDDTIHGGDGSDQLQGGSGNDVLNGGWGKDMLLGDAGDDQFFVDDFFDEVFEAVGQGNDTVFAASSFTLATGQEIETLKAEAPNSIIALNFTGNEFANTIVGNNGANFLRGAGGVDTLQGRLGNDIYALDNGADTIIDTGGVDTITSTISRSLASYGTIERLALAGKAAINGVGNDLANILTGNAAGNALNGGLGDDTLNGGASNDVLIGGLGKDVMTGGLDNDVFQFAGNGHSLVGANADVIKDFDDFGNDQIDVSGLFGPAMTYRHSGAFTAAGQVRINDIAGADVIVEVNSGGSLAADFAVRLTSTALASMSVGDFIL